MPAPHVGPGCSQTRAAVIPSLPERLRALPPFRPPARLPRQGPCGPSVDPAGKASHPDTFHFTSRTTLFGTCGPVDSPCRKTTDLLHRRVTRRKQEVPA